VNVFIINDEAIRLRAIEAVRRCPTGQVVSIKGKTRTLEQNARLWPALHDVADQIVWHGVKLTAEEWKDVFTAALKRQKAVPGIDGGFVVVGGHTSTMTKADLSELLDLIYAFGSERAVNWSEREWHSNNEK
jgi:hypothetical protein